MSHDNDRDTIDELTVQRGLRSLRQRLRDREVQLEAAVREIFVLVDGVPVSPDRGAYPVPSEASHLEIQDELKVTRFQSWDLPSLLGRTFHQHGVQVHLHDAEHGAGFLLDASSTKDLVRYAASTAAPVVAPDGVAIREGPLVEDGRFVLVVQCAPGHSGSSIQVTFEDAADQAPITAVVSATGLARIDAATALPGPTAPAIRIVFVERDE